MRRETGVGMDETEGIVDKLRAIDGVELAILVKEDVDKIRLSLRVKSRANVGVKATIGSFKWRNWLHRL